MRKERRNSESIYVYSGFFIGFSRVSQFGHSIYTTVLKRTKYKAQDIASVFKSQNIIKSASQQLPAIHQLVQPTSTRTSLSKSLQSPSTTVKPPICRSILFSPFSLLPPAWFWLTLTIPNLPCNLAGNITDPIVQVAICR